MTEIRAYAAILITYRRPNWLELSVSAVLEQTIPPVFLIVVDNDADPGVGSYVEGLDPPNTKVHYASTPTNLGPAGGLKRGLQALGRVDPEARVGLVLFLDDDDPLPITDTVACLLEFRSELEGDGVRVGAVGVVGARWDDRRARLRRVSDSELIGALSIDYIGGGHAPLYDRAALDEIGGVDESLFFGFEELDLGFRLKKAGFALYAHGEMLRELRMRQGRLGLGTLMSRTHSEVPWRTYYGVRNLILLVRAHRSFRQALQATMREILGGLRRGRSFRACLQGVFDAWRGRRGIRMLPDHDPKP